MKIWRKDSTKPIKSDVSSDEDELTDINQTSTPKQTESKQEKMEEIYSTKSKKIKYRRQTPLEAEEALRLKEKLASGEAEIKLEESAQDAPVVELTTEFDEEAVIADDIIEDVGQLSPKRNVQLQDVDQIDIDLNPSATVKKYERQVSSTTRHDERQKPKQVGSYERLFGKPKLDFSGERVVTKVPKYQHDSKVNEIPLKAGKFSDVVESEYDEYLKSSDPVISKRPDAAPQQEGQKSLLYTLSQLAEKKGQREKTSTPSQPEPIKTAKNTPKKPQNKVKKFFRILLRLIFPKQELKSAKQPNSSAAKKPQSDSKAHKTIDYQSRQDQKYLSHEISSNLRKLLIKSAVLSVLFIVTLVLTIMERASGQGVFNGAPYTSLIFCAVYLAIMVITGFVCKSFIESGLKPLRNFRGNSDTAIAFAYIACLLQQVVSIFMPDHFVGGDLHLYTAIITFGFLLNTVGRAVMVARVKSNFRFITSKSPAYAAKIFNDSDTARKMLSGTTAARSVIAYQHETDFLGDFLKISYAPDPSEELSGKLAPITIVSSIFVGIAYGFVFKTVVGALSAFAVMCCISIPICALLAGNLPLMLLCRNSLDNNAMISGYPSIRQFCDCDAVMATSAELYPKGSIILNKIRTFTDHRVDESLLQAAAILKDANSPLMHVFNDALRQSPDKLPKVESVMYEDKLGLVGWVGGERVLIGNRKLLDRYHIYLEDAADETSFTRLHKDVTYIACSGQLVAMLVTTYTADEEVRRALTRAHNNGLCLVVSTTDSNITEDKIATDFGIYQRTIKILSTGYAATCASVCERKEETSRSYLATRGKFTSLMHAVTAAINFKQNLTMGIIIQIFGLILGVLLCATMVLYATVSILGVAEMLLYMLFWGVAAIAAQFVKRP